MVKLIYEKSTANIILNGETLKIFPQHKESDKDNHFHHSYSI